MDLYNQPNEILESIFMKFGLKEIYYTILTCKKFKNILDSENLWKYYLERDFPKQKIKFYKTNSKKIYKTNLKGKKLKPFIDETKLELVIEMENITTIPREIKFFQLKKLTISNDILTYIPKDLCFIKTLEYLDLSLNFIQSIPKKICLLVNLQTLYLSTNLIKKIPDSLYSLSELTDIDLNSNKITHITEKICDMKKLRYLNITNNRIKNMPNKIKGCGFFVSYTKDNKTYYS